MDFQTFYIDLTQVETISHGDQQRMVKYIRQFQELISERLELLQDALQQGDRVQVRQITHKMIPQLQFFGIKDISIPINRLELEYSTMPMDELYGLVEQILVKLKIALAEVSGILKDHFD